RAGALALGTDRRLCRTLGDAGAATGNLAGRAGERAGIGRRGLDLLEEIGRRIGLGLVAIAVREKLLDRGLGRVIELAIVGALEAADLAQRDLRVADQRARLIRRGRGRGVELRQRRDHRRAQRLAAELLLELGHPFLGRARGLQQRKLFLVVLAGLLLEVALR